MASGLVIHIASGGNRSTEVLTQERIRIGVSPECELQLPSSGDSLSANTHGPVIELARHNGFYRVANFDHSLQIVHNGRAIAFDAPIRDGDEVRVDPANVLLTFFPVEAQPALVPGSRRATHVAPFIEQAGLESSATTRRDDAKVFLREFTRELVREINPATKLVTLAIALILVGGVLYIGFALFSEVRRSRRTIDDQRTQMAAMSEQVAKANQQLSALGRSNKEIRDSLSLAVKLRSDYGGGVCMISASYIFVETRTGRPLRYPEDQMNESGAVVQNANEQGALTPDGKGAVREFESLGTGFLVGDGFVLTNRHVAQPWLADERAQSLNSTVPGQPRLKKLVAFFPDQVQPVVLKFKEAAQREDLAVCTFDLKDMTVQIPVLPLEKDSDTVAVGRTVVTMGYPLGPDRLLALLDENEARSVQARYGSLEALLGYFAQTKHIQPQTTQGSITDLNGRSIVYDARTAEGGSGAPLFGPSGRVIGISYGVLPENTASNFAVPVRYAIALLQRGGWRQPEGIAGEQNENSNASQTNPRSPTGSVNAH
ncbi:MAG TPA: trypsin-like peptidase domain-containing protein [Pyrinomonadaceae bacterium]|jgi:S1-C subfamily serine protease